MKIQIRDRTGGRLVEPIGALGDTVLQCTLEDASRVAGSLYARGLDVTLEHARESDNVDAVLWVGDPRYPKAVARRWVNSWPNH
jgi:hypothetical protein